MYPGKKQYLLYVLAITLLYLMSCGAQKRYEVLSFFFDGVPAPGLSEINTAADSSGIDSTVLLVKSNKLETAFFWFHSPYKKKECTSCHDQKIIGKTKVAQPELCYQCHDDYKETFKFVHGPVGGGFCVMCHNPHKSKQQKLLSQPVKQQCLHCHDSLKLFKNKFHENREKKTCIECHNPHGGENRFLPQHGSCYNCHNDLKKEYTFLHGPVTGEYCTSCHGSHIENTKEFLLRDGKQLCLDCHNEPVIYKSEYHKNKEANCIDCHNPHGGKNRFFIKFN